jgi:hypothetical protein
MYGRRENAAIALDWRRQKTILKMKTITLVTLIWRQNDNYIH